MAARRRRGARPWALNTYQGRNALLLGSASLATLQFPASRAAAAAGDTNLALGDAGGVIESVTDEASGGHYFTAEDGDALLRSLARVTSRYPFAVLDEHGRTVAQGITDGAPVELKPGQYRLVL